MGINTTLLLHSKTSPSECSPFPFVNSANDFDAHSGNAKDKKGQTLFQSTCTLTPLFGHLKIVKYRLAVVGVKINQVFSMDQQEVEELVEVSDEEENGYYSENSDSIGSVDGLDSDVDDVDVESNDSSGETGDDLPLGIEGLLSDSNDEDDDEDEPELAEGSDEEGDGEKNEAESDNSDEVNEAGTDSDQSLSGEKEGEKVNFEEIPISNKRVYLQIGGKRHRNSSEVYPTETKPKIIDDDDDETDFEIDDEIERKVPKMDPDTEEAQESTVEDMISLIGESMSSNQLVMGWNWKPVRAAAAAALEEISSGKTQGQLHELRKKVYLLKPNVPRGKSRRSQTFKPKPSNKVKIIKAASPVLGLRIVPWIPSHAAIVKAGDICAHQKFYPEIPKMDIFYCQVKQIFQNLECENFYQVQWLVPIEGFRPWKHTTPFRWEYFERPIHPDDKEEIVDASQFFWVARCYNGYFEDEIKKDFPGFVPFPEKKNLNNEEPELKEEITIAKTEDIAITEDIIKTEDTVKIKDIVEIEDIIKTEDDASPEVQEPIKVEEPSEMICVNPI